MSENKFYFSRDYEKVLMGIGDNSFSLENLVSLEPLIPNTFYASSEKHIPTATFFEDKLTVTIGEVEHPMNAEHYIMWVIIHTKRGGTLHKFLPTDHPKVTFTVVKEDVLKISAYCNLHGLWELDLENYYTDETICSADFSSGCNDEDFDS